jgi:26S proteasome regulatory subunit N1
VEDKELKEKIDAHVERLLEGQFASLRELKHIVRSATTAMTSVPKPFKFLKTHYPSLT